MSKVILGSARTSHTTKGGQVSTEPYYTHKQGYWLGFKPKEGGMRLANAMQNACDNDHFLYSQPKRDKGWEAVDYFGNIHKVNQDTYVDCSSLVRLCIREAYGVKLPNFNTQSEPTVLRNCGLFELPKKIRTANECTLGMVLCTPNKGHTVIVVETDNKYGIQIPSSNPMLRKGSTGQQVRLLQACLNIVMKSNLEVDGIFGKNTDKVLRDFQKKYNLEVDGIYGSKSRQKLQDKLR